MPKPIIYVILAALLFSSAWAQNISGPLSGNLGPGTFFAVGAITVLNGSTLVIAPGTTIKFTDVYGFSVAGTLRAIGTLTDSIRFMCNTGVASWEGIDFLNATCSASVMAYCYVNGSGCMGLSCWNGASPAIRHCNIVGNSAGSG